MDFIFSFIYLFFSVFVCFALIEFACVSFSLDTESSFVYVFFLQQFVLESEGNDTVSEKRLTGEIIPRVTRKLDESQTSSFFSFFFPFKKHC